MMIGASAQVGLNLIFGNKRSILFQLDVKAPLVVNGRLLQVTEYILRVSDLPDMSHLLWNLTIRPTVHSQLVFPVSPGTYYWNVTTQWGVWPFTHSETSPMIRPWTVNVPEPVTLPAPSTEPPITASSSDDTARTIMYVGSGILVALAIWGALQKKKHPGNP